MHMAFNRLYQYSRHAHNDIVISFKLCTITLGIIRNFKQSHTIKQTRTRERTQTQTQTSTHISTHKYTNTQTHSENKQTHKQTYKRTHRLTNTNRQLHILCARNFSDKLQKGFIYNLLASC